MATLLIRNGRLIDPERNLDEVRDLWVCDGRVAAEDFTAERADKEIDATGLLVMPGLVDAHVHLREPGGEEAETIASGCAAALAGGFTSIVAMPNTNPATDTPERVQVILDRAAAVEGPRVFCAPTITLNRHGDTLTDIAALAENPVVAAFTDDGTGIENDDLCRDALKRIRDTGRPLAQHCEYRQISAGGVINAGPVAERMGLPGYPPEAETKMIERDIRLSAELDAAIHFQHLSAAKSVELVKAAKAEGVRVTAEATPHHLTLTDEDAARGGANFKMNPPLRAAADRDALQAGLRDGAIEMVATDHAPHSLAAKAQPFLTAPFGVIGMETAAAAIWTCFVRQGFLTPLEMADRMAAAPRRIFLGDRCGGVTPGRPCDVVLFDPEAVWTVDPEKFHSRSRNCPFAGWVLQGRVQATLIDGEVCYRAPVR